MIQEKERQSTPEEMAGQGERLLGVIPDVYKSNFFGVKTPFDIIITSKRMIFVVQPANSWPATGRLTSAEKYVGKTTAGILSENKKNRVIDKEQIKSVNFKLGKSYIDCCRKLVEVDGEVEVSLPETRHVFSVQFRRQSIAKNLLTRAGLPSLKIVQADSGTEEKPSSQGSCCSH